MPLVKNLLLGGLPTLAIGGAGFGVWMKMQGSNAAQSENKLPQTGIVVGPDATPTNEPEDLIRKAGLNCGDAKAEKDCNIGSTGLNVDISNNKKEGLFPSAGENGKIKFRLLNDNTYSNNFRFTITEKPIKLQNKSNPSDIITLNEYDTYEVVKDSAKNKAYLTRKFTADQWIKKALGLPDGCNLPTPTAVSEDPFDYSKATCEPKAEEIKLINFEGKKDGGATSAGSVKLYIKKVNDTKTFKGGYKFTFHPFNDVDISTNDQIKANIWKDFGIKDPNADDLVLEKVWKNTDELLKEVGLSCSNGTCTINDGSLKIKVGDSSMEDGKKKADGGTGTLKLERNRAGHYEGLRFEVQGGKITIESSASSASTVQMQELEIFHIKKEDKNDSSYYLTLKHDIKEMILYHLGLNGKECSLPDGETPKTCSIPSKDLNKIKFYEGGGEKTITANNSNLSVTITIAKGQESTYPFGYKFSLKTTESGTITIGGITLTNNSATDFKIKKESGPKLYLEKVG